MKTEEKNKQFIDILSSGNFNVEDLQLAARVAYGIKGKDAAETIVNLQNSYDKHNRSYDVEQVADEYNHLRSLQGKNRELWLKYRDNKALKPIAKSNGEYINIEVEALQVVVDGVQVSINAKNDCVSFTSNQQDGNGTYAVINRAVMSAILRTADEFIEAKNRFE